MSSSTALLPKKKKDHPIFMRICHSSWSFIGQQSLVNLRTIVAAYLVGSFIALIDYDLRKLGLGWRTIFELPNITFAALVIYHVLAAVWSYMHLHHPHHASKPRSFSTRVQKILSPPRQNNETKNRDWFSIFYFATHAFTLIAVTIFWAVLYPNKETTVPANTFFGHDDYTSYYILNKYGLNALVAILEVFFLNGHIRSLPLEDHPKRITWHIVAFFLLAWSYIGWAYIGHHYTGKYSYFFLDYHKLGGEYTWFSVFSFVTAVEIAALFLWLLTALKEKITEKETKNNGYSVLPH